MLVLVELEVMSNKIDEMFYIPAPDRRLRLLTMGYGLLLFIWLSPEDNVVWPAALMGVGLALLGSVWLVQRWLDGSAFPAQYVPIGAALIGTIVGLVSALSAAGLMFFKNALHAHIFWDFPPGMVAAMLTRAPSWALAGGLAGLGIGCLWLWRLRSKIV
jgi:hypothetical protein